MTRQTHQEFKGDSQQQVEIPDLKDNVNMVYTREPWLTGSYVWLSDMIVCRSHVYTAMVQSLESLSSPFQTA